MGAAWKLERDAESRGKIEMNQLIRVHREMSRGWGRGDIRDRHAQASKGRARPTQNAYLHAKGGTQAREWPPHGVPGTQVQG
jgi:hypothetical protein